MTESKTKTNAAEWQKYPVAKRHQIINTISGEFRGTQKTDTFEVYGKLYTLRTLDPSEIAWADAHVAGDNLYQVAQNKRAPYVAASLVAVGEIPPEGGEAAMVPVEDLFQVPEEMPEPERKALAGDSTVRDNWLRTQVLAWLLEPDQAEPFIQALYNGFLLLEIQRAEALGALGPLSRAIRTGALLRMSSQEKESSSPIPASAA